MSKHDPMEEFFRDRAENYEYPYEEKDWLDLEARLDHELPRSGSNFWGHVLMGILLISLPWWPWTNERAQVFTSSESTQQTEPVVTPAAEEESISPSAPRTEDRIESNTAVTGTENSATTITETPSAVISEADQNPTITNGSAEDAVQNKPVLRTQRANYTTENTGRETQDLLILRPKNIHPDLYPAIAAMPHVYPSLIEESDILTTGRDLSAAAISSESEDIKLPDPSRSFRVWRPYLLTGFEYGGTQMGHKPEFGWRAGAGVRFRPIRPLSFDLGLQYGHIGYSSFGKEYALPSSALSYGETLMWTDGTCKMLEIPIQLRWHPLRWFNVSAGIKSYYIVEQSYDLYIEDDYGPSYKYPYWNDEDSDVWMGHLMLGLGFNVPVGSYQIELQPFYQVPLKQIGVGKVEWYSVGGSMVFLF